jgi:hypothetical protein
MGRLFEFTVGNTSFKSISYQSLELRIDRGFDLEECSGFILGELVEFESTTEEDSGAIIVRIMGTFCLISRKAEDIPTPENGLTNLDRNGWRFWAGVPLEI